MEFVAVFLGETLPLPGAPGSYALASSETLCEPLQRPVPIPTPAARDNRRMPNLSTIEARVLGAGGKLWRSCLHGRGARRR